MKIPGIIRKVDTLGRVVIPQSLRSSMGVNPHTTKVACFQRTA